MCGIVGFIDKNKSINIIDNMLKVQSHRGPDDRGKFFDKNTGVHLGHNPPVNTRSKFRWASAIHKRMSKLHYCFFNGEVYNFKAIRKTLIKLGHKFISQTDTEVITIAINNGVQNV